MAMATALELVIFDCDGVLVDSEKLAIPIDQVMLRDAGIEMSDAEVIDRFVGRSSHVMLDAIEERLGHPPAAADRARYERMYRDAYEAELEPVDGVIDALNGIPHRMCVASSSEPEGLYRKLEITGLRARFEGAIFSAVEVSRGKPAPDLFLHAAQRMGAHPAACVVIEDSRHGVTAARAAGMDAYGYAGGLTPAQWLAGPRTTVFCDMRQLPALIAERVGG
jgi:HAD superfamily hydrolase (TIGR01509 family)